MATATKKRSVTSVTVKDGEAVVFVHHSVSAISHPSGLRVTRPEDATGRTWSFGCSPAVARDLIERYEFVAQSESGVPLTVDEKREAKDLKEKSAVEVGRMAQALAQMADERVAKESTGS